MIAIGTVAHEELTRKLAEAQATIAALLSGQVDAILDARNSTVVLLSEAQAALVQSKERKAAILDSVLDCIFTMDGRGRVIELNAAAERTFGYGKAAAVGRLLADLIIPPAHREKYKEGLARAIAGGKGPLLGRLTEAVAMRLDGSELPVEMRISAIKSGHEMIFTGVVRDITARKQADETRARLAAIVDSSDDAIFSTATDGTIVTWNAGAARLFGYESADVIGRDEAMLVPPDRRDELARILERAARGQPSKPVETQRRRHDGTMIDVSVTVSPVLDATLHLTGVSTIARDITSGKRAQAALREERDRAQRYLDTAEVILLTLDMDGVITMINRHGCELLGWSTEELVGRDFIETCVPARLRATMRGMLRGVHEGPESSIIVNPLLTRRGEEHLIEWRNVLLRDAGGTVVSTLSSGTDMTAAAAATEAVRVAEERTQFVLKSADVGMWDMDFTSGVLQWSEIAEAHYGVAPGTFAGTFEAFTELIHPDDRVATLATLDAAIKAGGDFTVSNRSLGPDGVVRWLNGKGSVQLGPDGTAVRAVGVSIEVTERRLLEEQAHQAQKMEAVGRLAGGVAHDFNNLLMVITGYADIIRQEMMANDPRRQDLDQIRKAADTAASLTRQLLAFSRQQVIEPKDVVLEEAVTSATLMLRRVLGEDVDVVLQLGTTPVSVRIDPGQLEQVIMNLAINARDAMPTGGQLTIETGIVELTQQDASAHWPVQAGRFALLAVSDTGIGMDATTRAKVFEPFFTTKEQGKGTGLGLATVHGIVTQSGGFIWLYSEPGMGACFKIYLPIVAEGHAAQALRVESPAPRGAETIMLVEDSDGVRDITRRALEDQGYHVLAVSGSAEALETARAFEGKIDLLLTDVVMPGMSGRVLAETFLEDRPRTKLLYMSGYTDDAVVRHGVLRAEMPFLQKPFAPLALAVRVRSVLDAA